VLRIDLKAADLSRATVVVPEGKGVIEEIAAADSGIYVSEIFGGPSELKYYARGNNKASKIPMLPISTIAGVQSWKGDEVTFGNVSYTQPFAWYTYHPVEKEPSQTALRTISPVDFNDIEVTREFAVSKDGTKILLNILRKKRTALNGQNPTLLYGYGGYARNLAPTFDPTRRIWFDAGGIYVVANLRGGGEYGEKWHKQGNLTLKQNVFDDFIAAAEHLIKRATPPVPGLRWKAAVMVAS
jgi:prolyl oligopeptidase